MPVLSYGRAFAWHSQRDGERIAIVHERERRTGGALERTTRGELERWSNRLARDYAKRGVREGDLVTIGLPNGSEFFAACLATWKLGATPQPISARLPAFERRAILALARPALAVGVDPQDCPGHPTLAAGHVPDGSLADTPLPDVVPRHVRCMTSGGSTGRPKLILELAPATCDPETPENGMQRDGTVLVPGPLYHAGPFITAWQALLSGGTVIVLSRFDPLRCLELIEEHRVDWVLFVPTMMQRIWRLPDEQRARFDLSSLRRVMSSGAASPAWLKRAWIGWLGPERIWEAYGGSERIAGTLISGTEWLAHPGSVGRPGAGRKIRVVDARGRDCAPGEIGEVYMMPAAGQGTTYRYIGAEPVATPDGWETLGDLGTFDADGYLYLVDRKTDMIVVGGANVYPAEVEAALDAHPRVRSSAVVGLPDEDLGARLHAIYEAEAEIDPAELREHLAKHLAGYKLPKSFERVAHPLRDDAGKVRRSALRDERVGPAERGG